MYKAQQTLTGQLWSGLRGLRAAFPPVLFMHSYSVVISSTAV